MRAGWLLCATLAVALFAPTNALAEDEPPASSEPAPDGSSGETSAGDEPAGDEEEGDEPIDGYGAATPDAGGDDEEASQESGPTALSFAAEVLQALAQDPHNESLQEAAEELPQEIQQVVTAVLDGCQPAVEVSIPAWERTVTDTRPGHLDIVDLIPILVVGGDAVAAIRQLPVHLVIDWQEEYAVWEPTSIRYVLTVPAGQPFLDSGNGALSFDCDGEASPVFDGGCQAENCWIGAAEPEDGWTVVACSFMGRVLLDGAPEDGSFQPDALRFAPHECVDRILRWAQGLAVGLQAPAGPAAPVEASAPDPASSEPALVEEPLVEASTDPTPHDADDVKDTRASVMGAGAARPAPAMGSLAALIAAAVMAGLGIVVATIASLRGRT